MALLWAPHTLSNPTCGFKHYHHAYYCDYPQLLCTSNDQERVLNNQTQELLLLTINIPSFNHPVPRGHMM